MSKSPLNYLKHIADECQFLSEAILGQTDKTGFLMDEVRKRAAVRSLEIIGEATKNLPADFKAKWNQVEWKNMVGMRDRLIHAYFGVNYTLVWDVIVNKVPNLHRQVILIIKQENE
jgi:uncharacterized protein with HEPN domain